MSENLPEPKMSLHQLVQLSNEIKSALTQNYGEVTDEVMQALMTLERKLPSKADGYKFVIDDLDSEVERWKARAADFIKISKAFETYAKSLKESIKGACISMGTEEIQGVDYRWKLMKAKPTVIIDDETKIPSGHKEIVQTTVIKKDGILEDLKQGLPVPGAHLEESLYVRCFPNTKSKGEKKNDKGNSDKPAKQLTANAGNDGGAS